MNMGAFVNSLGTAVPELFLSQLEVLEILEENYARTLTPRAQEVMQKTTLHPGIAKRHFASENKESLLEVKNEDPDIRMERFRKWALKLSSEALQSAVSKCGIEMQQIDALIINTCTGYLCPGISSYIIEQLGLSPSTFVYDLVGAGCGGAIPNLQLAKALSENSHLVVAGVAVEICSATFQMGNDLSLLVSNALFADGAAAYLCSPRKNGFIILNSVSETFPQYRETVRYVYKNGQLHNQLHPHLPKIIESVIPGVVGNMLLKSGKSLSSVRNWAIHSGGSKILDSVQSALKLSDDDVQLSRSILKEYGNMSSPTALFALDKIQSVSAPGEITCVLGFGAGMSVHGCLLEKT